MCIASLGISQPPPLGGKRFQTMAGACTERQSLLGLLLVVNCSNHKPNNLKYSRYCHIDHLYCSYEIKDSNRNKIALKCKHRFYWQRLKFCSFNNRTFHFRLKTRPEKWSSPIIDFHLHGNLVVVKYGHNKWKIEHKWQ